MLLNLLAFFCFCALHTDGFVQDFYWRDYIPGDIPYDAIQGVPGRYIGQVNYEGNLVATIYPFTKLAVAEWSGRKDMKNNVKILCSPEPGRFYWEAVDFSKSHDRQMQEAVKGGYQKDLDVDLFIGKALNEGEWKIGKVVEIGHRLSGLWIWNKEGNSVNSKTFELLKYNSTLVGEDGEIIFSTNKKL